MNIYCTSVFTSITDVSCNPRLVTSMQKNVIVNLRLIRSMKHIFCVNSRLVRNMQHHVQVSPRLVMVNRIDSAYYSPNETKLGHSTSLILTTLLFSFVTFAPCDNFPRDISPPKIFSKN